jgi:hypothetical protein
VWREFGLLNDDWRVGISCHRSLDFYSWTHIDSNTVITKTKLNYLWKHYFQSKNVSIKRIVCSTGKNLFVLQKSYCTYFDGETRNGLG